MIVCEGVTWAWVGRGLSYAWGVGREEEGPCTLVHPCPLVHPYLDDFWGPGKVSSSSFLCKETAGSSIEVNTAHINGIWLSVGGNLIKGLTSHCVFNLNAFLLYGFKLHYLFAFEPNNYTNIKKLSFTPCTIKMSSPHGCKSIHGTLFRSTPPVSRWLKPFHHAPPTTHATSTYPTPSTTAFKAMTPEEIFF